MAGEWTEVLLGDIVQNYDSKRIPLSGRERALRQGQFPYYGATGVMDYVDDYLFQGLHLLVAEDGSVERSDGMPYVQLVDGKFWVNNHAHVLRGKTDEDTKFLYYALQGIPVRPFMSGSVQAKLSQGNLNRIPVLYPMNESERHAIAYILGTLDDKMELNRRMNETLEAMARSLFKSWFVDFDPVRANAEGRDTGLPKHIADLFPARFVDSELGEIPEGWEAKSLDQIAKFLNGLALQKYPPTHDRSLPVIKIAQLRSGRADGSDRASADLDPDYIIVNGDILFSWSGSLECVLWSGGSGALNQHLFKVTSSDYPRWLCYFAVHHHLDNFRHIAAGKATTMGHIQRHHLSDTKIAVPAKSVLREIDQQIAPLFERLWMCELESQTLASLRDTLLPKLISGELRVKNAEKFIGRTLA